ncbi:sulfatase [Verrucomicrobiota bacterium]
MTQKPNILLITADDMNWDAVGAYGCPVTGTTPHIDRLADEGIRFDHAHVTIAVCQPSRSTLMTGRYPHRNGGEGFFRLRIPDIPILPQILRESGYLAGILGKVSHSTPYAEFEWDTTLDMHDLGHGRSPERYGHFAAEFLKQAKEAEQPFFLMLNSHDPHRPFYGNDKPEWYKEGDGPSAALPSHVFTHAKITTPGCLADLPDVRLEISEYYNSVRRCDDTVGEALNALRQAGCEKSTIVIFLSDNGMSFPFAKTNCYLNSTRTPWIMRWPGMIHPGARDTEHFISGIDLMPSLLDAAGINAPPGMDGRSFLPLLRGDSQDGRDLVFTQFHQNSAKNNYPMRCVQDRRFGYIFNGWSNGVRVFKNESQMGRTMRAMRSAAETDPIVADRVNLFLYRVTEEFYDFENDPDALRNLINDPNYTQELQVLQERMEKWMERTEDPALTAFRNRDSQAALDQLMEQVARKLGGE